MRALVLSGGASKGAFTAGAVQYMLRDKRMQFELAIGTSTGSLVGGPALLGDWPYCGLVYTNVTNREIFKNSLIGKIIGDTPIDAKMDPLHDLLKQYYLVDGKLDELIGLPNKELVVTCVNVRTGKVHYVSSNEVRRQQLKKTTFVRAILASCCEPVFTEPVQVYQDEEGNDDIYGEFHDDLFYDGGVKEFMPLEKAVRLGADEVWAISTHPLDLYEETTWGGTKPADRVSIFESLGWTINSLLEEVARGDRQMADLYLRWDLARVEMERLAAQFGLPDQQRQQLVAALATVVPLGRGLANLYMIAPESPMRTSLRFDRGIMRQYLTDGERCARNFFRSVPSSSFAETRPADWINEQTFG